MSALKTGDHGSLRQVYGQYHAIIYYYTLKFVKQESLAEEVTADVFIKLWHRRSIINPELPVQALLYKIAKDTAYNYLKKVASDARLRQRYLDQCPVLYVKSGELLFLEKEHMAEVEQIIGTLPPKRMEVFKLRYYKGEDNQSIAHRLKISINTVKVHLVKARHYLRQQLSLHEEIVGILFGMFSGWLAL